MNATNDITICSNSTANNFTIAFIKNARKVALTITDIAGKLIYTAVVLETEKMNVTASSFVEGFYIVKIQTEECLETRKLIVGK